MTAIDAKMHINKRHRSRVERLLHQLGFLKNREEDFINKLYIYHTMSIDILKNNLIAIKQCSTRNGNLIIEFQYVRQKFELHHPLIEISFFFFIHWITWFLGVNHPTLALISSSLSLLWQLVQSLDLILSTLFDISPLDGSYMSMYKIVCWCVIPQTQHSKSSICLQFTKHITWWHFYFFFSATQMSNKFFFFFEKQIKVINKD